MDHFVSISAPTTMDFIINRFCSIVGASEKTKKRIDEEFSSAWPSARLLDTNRLGHSRILQDEGVIQAIASEIL